MKITMIACLCLLTGCATSLMSRTPVQQTVVLQESPDAAYVRATRAMAALGGEITHTDTQARVLSARVHRVVTLTVQVRPATQGATVEVTGTLVPGKLAVGSFDEVDTYVALLR